MDAVRLPRRHLPLAAAVLLGGILGAAEAVPDQSGALVVASASLFGGDGAESFNAVMIRPDLTVVAGGACAAAFAVPGLHAAAPAKAGGFIMRLDAWGKPLGLAFLEQPVVAIARGPKERIYVRDDSGTVSILEADGGKVLASFPTGKSEKPTLAVDSNGEVVVTVGSQLQRYDAAGKQVWAQTPPAHGKNRPHGCAVDPKTGIAVVIGYGMTSTGKEPWKDPYAHGYDRSGKLLWSLWNNPPQDQKGAKYGGTGLMADGTGDSATVTADGKFLLQIHHDGGNAVTTRDPSDARKPLDKAVFAGSFQDGPGYGMKGAIGTSVCFRVDAQTGALEKGTWMCAWLENHHRANSLFLTGAASDERDSIYLIGDSASDLPVKSPWLPLRPDEYKGGSFLAAFDQGFAMQQCGAWSPGKLEDVAAEGGVVAIVGSATGIDKKSGKPIEAESQMRLLKPQAQKTVLGERDAFIAILHRKGVQVPATATGKGAP